MKHKSLLLLAALISLPLFARNWESKQSDFRSVPMQYRPNPLWFWNNTTVTISELEEQMVNFRDRDGYGGLSILPFGENFKPEYLTDDYFEVYGAALKKAKELGLTMWMYDEYGFPSGGIGLTNGDGRGRFKEQYPDETIKRLDKVEFKVVARETFRCAVPDGKVMAVVAMDTLTGKRIDLERNVLASDFTWNVPNGSWKLMFFMCRDAKDIVDYLDDEASHRFVEMTHEQYRKRFEGYFGSTLIGTFFDEPTLYHADGRCWTLKFNEKFKARYGFSPALYYPALWYNIGEDTEEARNYLFGFRADLYAEGFTKVVNDWSLEHGLHATGHQDNEEVVNPVGTSADLMKCFKYLEIPGVDKIGGDRPAELFYKVISGAAYNWDNSLVMSETYGAMGDIEWDEIYSIAMDQYAKGINILIPHAVWYDTSMVVFKPELSYRSPKYSSGTKGFNDYLTRLNVLLQNDGRFVADVAMVYPINAMQSGHYFEGPLSAYEGGVKLDDADYVDVSHRLFDKMGVDFLFLHPEVLTGNCVVNGNAIDLKNKVQYGSYSTLIFPSCSTVELENLRKAQQMYENGGKVIFTTKLPQKGTEAKDNKKVADIMAAFFPVKEMKRTPYGMQAENKNGGKVVFIETPDEAGLQHALSFVGYNGNVMFASGQKARHIHKIVNGKNIWFFANPEYNYVNTTVELKGNYKVAAWDPHTGNIQPAYPAKSERGKTVVSLTLDPYKSLFLVEE